MDLDKSPTTTIDVDGEQLENVNNFVYLGSRIDADGKSSLDIRRRIAIAISKLNTMAPLWKSQSTELQWRTLKACIFPVAIYGCKVWTNSKTNEKKITSFKMKCYRKILRISWTERKTNASVLEQLGLKAPQLLNLIKKQKLSYFGHIKQHNTLDDWKNYSWRAHVRAGGAERDPERDGRRTLVNGWESRLWRLEDKHLREGSSIRQFGRPRPLRSAIEEEYGLHFSGKISSKQETIRIFHSFQTTR